MRSILLLPLLLCLSAPAFGELVDLRARAEGAQGWLYFGFDQQPSAVVLEMHDTGAVLQIQGVSVEARSITSAHDEFVGQSAFRMEADALMIDLTATRDWEAGHAELVENGVVVRLTLGEPLAASGAVSAAEPVAQTIPMAADTVPTEDSTSHAPTPRLAMSACEAAEAAIAADPWNDAALIRHAACLAEAGDTIAAAGIYEQMLAFEPENSEIAYALAEIREAQGDRAGAAARYRQAAAHARSDAAAAAAINRARALEAP